ncbi:hypothetical protein CLV96_4007 [Leptospira meyeri]|uniref:Uncharacterized protein n=1 Tax=Leptospira meyeri TaxID=29508 RepID=A0A4R8MN10_LEPME|nr:hypothetical protein [Leptospira meyeri]EKJ86119.1 hypothetical protein LEP1GSC017_3976 [Leptospira meyeri serovar Hardjo str. Went 5]TDY66039.1 hypothetical protein CLV96_4007 [Leptospira meyeri]
MKIQLSKIKHFLEALDWKVEDYPTKKNILTKYINKSNGFDKGKTIFIPNEESGSGYEEYIKNILNILSETYRTHPKIIEYNLRFLNHQISREELLRRLELPILLLSKRTQTLGDYYLLIGLKNGLNKPEFIEYFILITYNDKSFFGGKKIDIESAVYQVFDYEPNSHHFNEAIKMGIRQIEHIVFKEIFPQINSYYSDKEYLTYLNLEPTNLLELNVIINKNKAFADFIYNHTENDLITDLIGKIKNDV